MQRSYNYHRIVWYHTNQWLKVVATHKQLEMNQNISIDLEKKIRTKISSDIP